MMTLFKTFLLFILVIGGVSVANAQTKLTAEKAHVRIKLISSVDAVVAGQSFDVLLEKNIDDHWHTYWKNPGDSGFPIQVKWSAPENVEMSELKWPVPHALDVQGIMNFVHEGQVHLVATVTIPEDYNAESFSLKVNADLLVCKEICIPESDEAIFELPVREVSNKANQDIFEIAYDNLPKNYDGDVKITEKNGKFQITLSDNPFETDTPVVFFSNDWGLVESGSHAQIRADGKHTVFSFPRTDRELKEISTFHGVLAQGRYGIHIQKNSLSVATNIESEAQNQETNTENGTATVGLLSAILFAIIGGMILNLMPCVFPILSMKALSLVKISAKHPAEAMKHGFAYTAGILVSFLALAVVILSLKAGGAEIGWGFQLQNPLVVLILTWLLFVIGLNLLGAFDITGRWTQAGSTKVAKATGLTQDFLTGVLAVIVATPCTAPFMGVALGYALTQSAAATILIFLGLGFGLALPFLLLSMLPVLQKIMPKPGAWMETFKQFLAFPMWATAIWLAWVLVQQSGTSGLLAVLSGALIIAFAVWLTQKGLNSFKIILLILCAVGLVKATQFTKVGGYEELSYTPEVLETALATNGPVFVNMTAAWCITCKINERVLRSDDISGLFSDKSITYIVGDWTLMNSDITSYLESFDRSGVPLYIYYPEADTKTGKRPEAMVLPQILTRSIITTAIESNK
ncbi:MAG: thioredoxin family protein [Alphaproteobacteria bacterium]|nr:thioredoxin family protein [Alphaproteobacteria bacterium]